MTAVDERNVGAVRPRARAPRQPVDRTPYINRELSWLDYSARVLFEAGDARHPLNERVKFLSIFAGMLDEFFQIRVAGLRQQVNTGSASLSPDGRTAAEQIAAARSRVLELVAELGATYAEIRRSLLVEGIEIVD
jgi:polyphosphate kinase